MQLRAITALIFLIYFSPAVLLSQSEAGNVATLPKINETYKMNLQNQRFLSEATALDAPINPDEYIVGPGDVLAIHIWGEVDAGYDLQITPEGKLLIPTVADIDLKELTLSQAKKKIAAAVKQKYLNCDVTVTLVHMRQFRVTVSGQVTMPGAVIVTAADRVSDAIRLANPPLEEEKKEEKVTTKTYPGKKSSLQIKTKKLPSKRHILLIRRNGQRIPVDLLGYEVTGSKEKNPTLIEGDVIYVPVYTKNLPLVGVFGAVHRPAYYEFMEGDRVLDLIKIAHGFTYNADPSNIEITRFNPDNKTTYTFKVDLSNTALGNGSTDNNILLKVDDRIYVRYYPEYRIRRQVQIKGEVIFPGYYPIEQNKTRLSEIVKAAGGFTQNASLKEAFVIRRKYENQIDLEYERLLEMKVEEMTELEREYFKIKSRERKGIVAVDFVKLFVQHDSTQDIILQDKDYIEIPAKDQVVTVSGQVVRPGLIAYVPGKSVNYYIKKAGGYGWNANKRKVRIIRGETGEWTKPRRNTIVYIGDTILVPEKPEKNYWLIFKDVISTTVQIATLVLVIQNATKK